MSKGNSTTTIWLCIVNSCIWLYDPATYNSSETAREIYIFRKQWQLISSKPISKPLDAPHNANRQDQKYDDGYQEDNGSNSSNDYEENRISLLSATKDT